MERDFKTDACRPKYHKKRRIRKGYDGGNHACSGRSPGTFRHWSKGVCHITYANVPDPKETSKPADYQFCRSVGVTVVIVDARVAM